MTPILLASGSPYRQQLLKQLGIEFAQKSPDIDETPRTNEEAPALAGRLAIEKANALASLYPDHLIIASDQVASLKGSLLHKPGSYQNAIAQLESCSGQCVRFYTALCLLNTGTQQLQTALEHYDVHFRELDYEQIERYVSQDQPFDCAGSFKAEGLGISLFTKLSGNDPNTLIGLPLIRLVDMLNNEGVKIP